MIKVQKFVEDAMAGFLWVENWTVAVIRTRDNAREIIAIVDAKNEQDADKIITSMKQFNQENPCFFGKAAAL